MGSPAHAAPKRGGHAVFVCGNASASDSFDPELTPDLFINTVRGAVHDGLFEVSSAGDVVPSLAADQEVNADATEWRFTLKDGATFHNGAPVRPDDVVATMRMHVREGSKSGMKGVLANMASVDKDGNAVIFKLTAPDADWPAVLAEIYLSILPSTDGTVEWRSGIGCGPYKLAELDPGVRARLERFENDHRDDRGWFRQRRTPRGERRDGPRERVDHRASARRRKHSAECGEASELYAERRSGRKDQSRLLYVRDADEHDAGGRQQRPASR